jgi:hypothetical protein
MSNQAGQKTATVMCRKCAAPNDPPFIFCGSCGTPRVKLNRYQVFLNLSLTMAAFMGNYYFQELVPWPWPIYLLYSLFFFQFSLLLAMGSESRLFRVALWVCLFLSGFGILYHSLNVDGPLFFLLLLGDIPHMAAAEPRIFYGTLALVAVGVVLPVYLRWHRLYGWVNAYRIILLFFFGITALGLIGLQGIKMVYDFNVLPELETNLAEFLLYTKPRYDHALNIVAVTILRLFLFEIFVFAAVRGYKIAHHQKLAANAERLRAESGFTRSLLHIAFIVRQAGVALDNMINYLLETTILLAKDIWSVLKAFSREILFPSAALVGCALLLVHLTNLTTAYIKANEVRTVVAMIGSLLGVLACEMVFLICKTHYRWTRVVEFHIQLLGWLLPNLIVFFLLISLSLYASTEALKSGVSTGAQLPFRIGMLTMFFGSILALLVAIILYRKRSVFSMQPVDEVTSPAEPHAIARALGKAAADAGGEAGESGRDEDLAQLEATIGAKTPATHGPLVKVGNSEGRVFFRRKRRGWNLGATEKSPAEEPEGDIGRRLVSAARTAVAKTAVGETARKAVENLSDRIHGKPEIVVRVASAKQKYAEKYYQWEALERTKDTISSEVYLGLRDKYLSELNLLLSERDQLQADLDRQHGIQLVERSMLEMKVSTLRMKLDEYGHLRKVGALSEKDYGARTTPLVYELKVELARLDSCQQKIDFLAAEVSAASREAPAGPPAGAV